MRPLALIALSVLAACGFVPDDGACTLVGCNSALTVDVPGLGADAFTATIESDTVNGSVTCPALDANGLRQGPVDVTGDLAGADAAFAAECDESAVAFALVRPGDTAMPEGATVVVTSGAATFTASADAIEYAISQPNGPECEPTCSNARLVAVEG